ncbi:MAG: radical SAM protein [Nitrospiraceae bacterium]|nr:MAG: radical SAM protein [Nitrospiraceae bacterium]
MKSGPLDAKDRLKVLAEDSRYDLSCACGTGEEDRRKRGGNGKWLYPLSLPRGGYSLILKTLLSNACVNNCKYCPLRSDSDVRRCMLQPEEVARLFMEYQGRAGVFGLFLSSGVIRNPDHTMDRINAVARILRRRYRYRGYIHLKIIPGASDGAIEDAVSLASAVSLNIETPGRRHFEKLSAEKDYDRDILRPLKLMSRLTARGMPYSRVKCTSQFIVGASEENDGEIISSMSGLYDRLRFSRLYFSAYQKGLGTSDVPGEKRILSSAEEPFIREHRLYQVDFLLRKYGFEGSEIPLDSEGNLLLDRDPKQAWADSHPEFYPVRINRAERDDLLRVPGLGPETVSWIMQNRRDGRISRLDHLPVRGKRLETIKRYAVAE